MINVVALPILESSQAGVARRTAAILAGCLDFDETERGKVGIVVTEIANNLVRHARDGVLTLRALEKHNTAGVEILALDKGPGIANVSDCLRDGFSTAGTSGTGLGAINRLSSVFEIYSVPAIGTAILARLWANPLPAVIAKESLNLGVVCLPIGSEQVSGDAWASEQSANRSLILVADGLGHGPLAAEASLKAVRVFREHVHLGPKEIVEVAHTELRSTRGAALAIAEIDFERQAVRFAGVGNIAATILAPEGNSNLVSVNGTVGHEVRKIQEFNYRWPKGGLLVMHTDGLGRWRLDRYPGLITRDPSLIAGVLYRDFNRGRDDVTVLVAHEEPS